MDGITVVALVLAIGVILVPVLLVWYLNIGGMRAAIRARKAKPARKARETA